uniref:Uncharacterized protein n=1 Tax=Salix viminalis TaxID=40686 RepID=A0A6N2LLP3_SALVM
MQDFVLLFNRGRYSSAVFSLKNMSRCTLNSCFYDIPAALCACPETDYVVIFMVLSNDNKKINREERKKTVSANAGKHSWYMHRGKMVKWVVEITRQLCNKKWSSISARLCYLLFYFTLFKFCITWAVLLTREFERLGNKVKGWTQKALVGTFMGGLNTEIADGIHMFKPQSLKDVINLAKMRDDQLTRKKRFLRLPPASAPLNFPPANRVAPTTPGSIKRLPWDEMQKRRA